MKQLQEQLRTQHVDVKPLCKHCLAWRLEKEALERQRDEGRSYGATHKRHYQFFHFCGACWEEIRRCPYASMWGSKWGDCLQMVPSNCVLNHMLIPWVSEVIYYCNYLEFGIICMFLTSFYAHFCVLCAQLVG